MKTDSSRQQTCILRTGKLFEHDIAANALSEKGIPFYKQMETSSGLRLAMPFQPAMGPGTYYCLFVPQDLAEKSTTLLSELPIDVTIEPAIWHFGASDNAKRKWKLAVWIILIFTFLAFLANILLRIKL
jgi:hypothetical protein